ncbi:ZW10 interactor-like [Carassius carassius]|uniref:ZW10 interactor-like n=1 Tax=Carassius carassius TaxID=217509 RepID=UPI002869302D|nr:ZW10 interactor-like [Carassius carassius]
MATERIEALLERTDPSFLKSCNTTEVQETGEGEIMAPYLIDCRRKQKHAFRQLCVVDDMIQLLAGLESVDQLLREPCPRNPGNEARSAWKALKAEYQERVQEVEGLINTLQARTEELQAKRKTLETLLSTLQIKKEECKEKERITAKRNQRAEKQISFQLEDSLQAAQNALNVCDLQLSKLKDEFEKQHARISDWTILRDGLQTLVSVTHRNMQYRLLSVSSSELCLELLPRAAEKSLEPLRVSITMTTSDEFHLQVFQGTAGLVEEAVDGRLRHVSAALVEVMERYISQGEMLSEIQALHSRFAIDWCPAEKLLIFLKTATTVCHLRVEEGYPSHGRATLLSVRKDGNLLDIAHLQPPVQHPVLTEWLEFLSSNPNI